jgi:hypothetical protein
MQIEGSAARFQKWPTFLNTNSSAATTTTSTIIEVAVSAKAMSRTGTNICHFHYIRQLAYVVKVVYFCPRPRRP